MDNIAGKKSGLSIVTNLSVLLLVLIWLIPTVGLAVSSFRDRQQISETGWWMSLFPVEQAIRVTPEMGEPTRDGDLYVLSGNVFGEDGSGSVSAFGITSRDPGAAEAGMTYGRLKLEVLDEGGEIDTENFETAWETGGEPQIPETDEDGRAVQGWFIDRALTMESDGTYEWVQDSEPRRAPSLYIVSQQPPDFGLQNYELILSSDNMDQAFINTLTVTIPATVIPILIAAFAAYALAWMDFPGRGWLVAMVVGLLVVPLQLALVPMLTLHNDIGIGQSFLGIWLAHTGFGLPLAIYILRNYMTGLPRDIIESAKVDGATDFQVFTKIVLPLSFPALASFAIFQFLWTWNDLLVAKVFLPSNSSSWVMTVKIADDLLGSRGGDWGILAAAAFVSIAVPLAVFFAMQKYLVRGLLAGSVK
ncbi:alpha-glucoside ABC transporter permease [Salipiger pallidus]|uniref:Alpha-glucoside ABC transporter permease n=1 Tax=Salipiger pallidus TaxID=1775170 RepID=A0A8J3EEV3_9RHOB|nr:carbohydrate ABC transporter permease [Salipiger pallidus]GGG60782.1 alpha-glucoside ABC transporter permease [Salipiger pallidus]